MEFRYAAEAEVPAMAALFAANHHDALTERQRARQGFVQGEFGEDALRAMTAAGDLLVAREEGRLAGLLAVSEAESLAGASPAVRGLLGAQGALRWEGRPLGEVRWLLYGPVVVDSGFRGRGVARGLFAFAVREAAGRAEALVAFIEAGNRASWRVHVEGFGMRPLGEFTASGRIYGVVAAGV